MKLTESQKDLFNVFIPVVLFWAVIGFFTVTQPDYTKTTKAPKIEAKHVQSPVLEKYGELITNNK